jgi:receptor expression-enhancing protein 5/6
MMLLCQLTSWYGMATRSFTSFKTLNESPQDDEKIKEALHFWIAFACIALFEFYCEIFVSWVPFYTMAKLALLWYIIVPKTKGRFFYFIEISPH